MKLMAPVNSMESCVAQIDAGAHEIYLGYRIDQFCRRSFSSRPQTRGDKFIMPDKNEFARIVNYAHERHVSVKLTANTMFFSDFKAHDVDVGKLFDSYICYAVECGVDAIIVSDIGLIYRIRKQYPKIAIYASTLLDVDNKMQIQFLKDIGVNRVVLAYQTTLDEIATLCENKIVEIEIFGYSGCSFGCNCMLGHGEKFGIPCENLYTMEDNKKTGQIIYSALNCGICGLWSLNKIGVDSIKIPGREKPYFMVLPLTRIFKRAIDLAVTAESNEEYINAVLADLPVWWKYEFCHRNQCKFSNLESSKKSISCLGGVDIDRI